MPPLVLQGFGFVSFLDPYDCAKALREKNGKYIGNRPCKLRKSEVRRLRRYRAYACPSRAQLCPLQWQERQIGEVRKKERQDKKMQRRSGSGEVPRDPGAAVEVRIRIDRGAFRGWCRL